MTSEDLSIKISLESIPRTPQADLQLRTGAILTAFQQAEYFFISLNVLPPRRSAQSLSRNPAKVPLNLCAPPTFIMLPTSLNFLIERNVYTDGIERNDSRFTFHASWCSIGHHYSLSTFEGFRLGEVTKYAIEMVPVENYRCYYLNQCYHLYEPIRSLT